MAYEITELQVYRWDEKHSANVAINDKFMLQLGTDGAWDIPHSDEACWNDESEQNRAHENLNAADLAEALSANKKVQHLINQEIFENE